MNNLLELLQSQLSDGLVDQLSRQVDGSPEKTKIAAESTIQTLLTALAKNAQNPNTAEHINTALERDHDGSILDNFQDILQGKSRTTNPKTLDGAGIVKHILGGNTDSTMEMISKLSGLSKNSSGKMLIQLAPLVMGALGKAKKQSNAGSSGLAQILDAALNQGARNKQSDPKMDLIKKFLDSDGDGSVMDELGSLGSKLLGGFLNK